MMERLLMIDTCGTAATVGLSIGDSMVAIRELGQNNASAEIVNAVRSLLAEAQWSLAELSGVAVVNGPGSFTGVRTGLAAAKGLCEAAGLPLIAVSRLEVLAEASGLAQGVAVFDAGRGELYAREITSGREWLSRDPTLLSVQNVVAGDVKAAERLAACRPMQRTLHLRDALPAMRRALHCGALDAAFIEANYVREEHDIYPLAAR